MTEPRRDSRRRAQPDSNQQEETSQRKQLRLNYKCLIQLSQEEEVNCRSGHTLLSVLCANLRQESGLLPAFIMQILQSVDLKRKSWEKLSPQREGRNHSALVKWTQPISATTSVLLRHLTNHPPPLEGDHAAQRSAVEEGNTSSSSSELEVSLSDEDEDTSVDLVVGTKEWKKISEQRVDIRGSRHPNPCRAFINLRQGSSPIDCFFQFWPTNAFQRWIDATNDCKTCSEPMLGVFVFICPQIDRKKAFSRVKQSPI